MLVRHLLKPDFISVGLQMEIQALHEDEHRVEVHVDPRITLNESFELFQARHKFFLVLRRIVNLPAKPFSMYTMIGGKPCTGTNGAVLVRDVVFVAVLLDHCYWLLVARMLSLGEGEGCVL